MREFKFLTQDAENRAQLMGRMMCRLEVDLNAVGRENLGARLREVANRCRVCDRAELCGLWLDGEIEDSYRDFCPNASTFDAFRRT